MLFPLFLTLLLAVYFWLSIRHAHLARCLFLAILPAYLIRFSLGPLPTTLLEMCFWILFGTWLVRLIKRSLALPHTFSRPTPTVLIDVGAFILLSFTSLAIVPHEHLLTALGLWRAYVLEPLLFGWMMWESLRNTPQQTVHATRIQWLLSLAFSGFIVAILGILQYVTGLGIPPPWDIEQRITSIFDYPNALGLFLAPIVSALLVFGISTWKKQLAHEKMFVVGASFFICIAIVLAQTEAALVAIPGALFVTFLVSPLPQKKQKIACVLFATLALASAFAITPVREKLLLQDFSGQVRLSQWKETATLLRDHPLRGAGIGYYPVLMRGYHHDWQYEIFQYPHTLLLNIWVELGLLGVGYFFAGMGYIAKKTWEYRNDALALAAGAALLTMVIHGLVDVPFFKNDLAMMTVAFTILLLSAHREKNAAK